MSFEYYMTNPAFQSYFAELPKPIRDFIVDSGVEFSTLGELQMCAEHLMQNNRQ